MFLLKYIFINIIMFFKVFIAFILYFFNLKFIIYNYLIFQIFKI